MPLDPLIANPAKLELPNPLADSQMFLQNALAMRQIDESNRKRKRSQVLDNAFATSRGADGMLDNTMLDKQLLDAGLGEELAGILQQRADLAYKNKQGQHIDSQILGEGAKTDETKMKTNHERLKAKGTWLTNLRTGFTGTQNPEQAKSVFDSAAQEAADLGVFTPEGATKWREAQNSELDNAVAGGTFAEYLNRHKLGAEKAAEQVFTVLNGKDQNKIVASSKFTPAPSRTVAAVDAPERKGVEVKINMPGQESVSEFDKVVGKGQGESFLKLQEAALGAPARVRDIDRTIGLIDSGKVFTGTGAEPKLEALRVASMLGVPVDKDLIRNTEEVIAGLVQNTLTGISRFGQMGVSLTPMSDKDLQMFRDASPQIRNSPEMIKRLLRVERQLYQDSVKMFNQRRNAVTSNPRTSPTIKAMSIESLPEIPNVVPKAIPQWKAGMKGVNGKPVNQKQFNELIANPSDDAEFDGWFGTGSAALLRGGTSKQATPFNR